MFPTLPKTVQDLLITCEYLLKESGQRFLLSHTTHKKKRPKNYETTIFCCSDFGSQY
jgi:hypothetical protein